MTAKEILNSTWRAATITKDGVAVAKEIELENRSERPSEPPVEPPEDEIVRGVD